MSYPRRRVSIPTQFYITVLFGYLTAVIQLFVNRLIQKRNSKIIYLGGMCAHPNQVNDLK